MDFVLYSIKSLNLPCLEHDLNELRMGRALTASFDHLKFNRVRCLWVIASKSSQLKKLQTIFNEITYSSYHFSCLVVCLMIEKLHHIFLAFGHQKQKSDGCLLLYSSCHCYKQYIPRTDCCEAVCSGYILFAFKLLKLKIAVEDIARQYFH